MWLQNTRTSQVRVISPKMGLLRQWAGSFVSWSDGTVHLITFLAPGKKSLDIQAALSPFIKQRYGLYVSRIELYVRYDA